MPNGGNGAALRLFEREVRSVEELRQSVLPRGRVEAVLLVDQALRKAHEAECARKGTQPNYWRFAFDREAFERDEDGNPAALRSTVARVSHALSAMRGVIAEVRSLGLQPVAVRKEEDDQMVVALWRHPRNPPLKEAEVRGFTVRLEEIPAGTQPAWSDWMAVVEDADAFES